MGAACCAIGVVIVGAGVAALWPGGKPKPATSGDRTAASAPARTQRGGPSPSGRPSGAAAGPALSKGRIVSYETTERTPGYFEGVLTLTNRTGAPLNGWQVSFIYPGAYIKNIWGGVLVRSGTNAVIRGASGAARVPVGGMVQVRFGAAGTPTAPRGCTLNGGPC
jgi:hypothetical protein